MGVFCPVQELEQRQTTEKGNKGAHKNLVASKVVKLVAATEVILQSLPRLFASMQVQELLLIFGSSILSIKECYSLQFEYDLPDPRSFSSFVQAKAPPPKAAQAAAHRVVRALLAQQNEGPIANDLPPCKLHVLVRTAGDSMVLGMQQKPDRDSGFDDAEQDMSVKENAFLPLSVISAPQKTVTGKDRQGPALVDPAGSSALPFLPKRSFNVRLRNVVSVGQVQLLLMGTEPWLETVMNDDLHSNNQVYLQFFRRKQEELLLRERKQGKLMAAAKKRKQTSEGLQLREGAAGDDCEHNKFSCNPLSMLSVLAPPRSPSCSVDISASSSLLVPSTFSALEPLPFLEDSLSSLPNSNLGFGNTHTNTDSQYLWYVCSAIVTGLSTTPSKPS